jgi:hypothetical protein
MTTSISSNGKTLDADGAAAETGGVIDRWREEMYASGPERHGEVSRRSRVSRTSRCMRRTRSRSTTDAIPAIRVSIRSRGVLSVDVSRPVVDDAPVRGVRDGGGDERRFRYLLEHRQTGLSTAFDMPTLMGYDSDHPRSRRGRTRRSDPDSAASARRRSRVSRRRHPRASASPSMTDVRLETARETTASASTRSIPGNFVAVF